MNRKNSFSLHVRLEDCPWCKGMVELEDCTRQDLGWNGFRIICRNCRVQMFSEPIGRLVVDETAHSIRMGAPQKVVTSIALDLVERWNRRGETDEARA